MIPLSLRARLLLGASGLFLVGLLIGWQTAVDGPDASGLKATRDEWSELPAHSVDNAKLIAGLNQHSLWGESAAADTGPTPEDLEKAKKAASEWHLYGIVDEHGHGERWAVIMTPAVGKAPPHVQNNKVGDELPDGSKLEAIEKTSITVTDANGQRQVVKMFIK